MSQRYHWPYAPNRHFETPHSAASLTSALDVGKTVRIGSEDKQRGACGALSHGRRDAEQGSRLPAVVGVVFGRKALIQVAEKPQIGLMFPG
jgi:hypothetical protein